MDRYAQIRYRGFMNIKVYNGMLASELKGVEWHRFSNSQGNCVEMAKLPNGQIGVRQSTDADGPVLVYTKSEIAAFVAAAKAGKVDVLLM